MHILGVVRYASVEPDRSIDPPPDQHPILRTARQHRTIVDTTSTSTTRAMQNSTGPSAPQLGLPRDDDGVLAMLRSSPLQGSREDIVYW